MINEIIEKSGDVKIKQFESKWKFEIIKNRDELESLSQSWHDLHERIRPNSHFSDFDWFIHRITSSNLAYSPYILVIYFEDNVSAIIAGWQHIRKVKSKIGYLGITSPALRCWSIPYDCIISDADQNHFQFLAKAILTQLKEDEIELIYLGALPLDSYLYQEFFRKKGILSGVLPLDPEPHWEMTIPHDLETLLSSMSRRVRENIRRYLRKIKKIQPPISLKIFTTEDDAKQFIINAEKIASKSYQRALNVGFKKNKDYQNRINFLASKGWFRSYVLFSGNKPVAFQEGIVYGNRYYLPSLGYDNDFSNFSPGKVLLAMSWGDLCQHPSIKVFDYGFGAGDYKEKYSDNCTNEGSFFLFNTSFKGRLIFLLIYSFNIFNKLIKKMVKRIGWYTKIKTLWRRTMSRQLKSKN